MGSVRADVLLGNLRLLIFCLCTTTVIAAVSFATLHFGQHEHFFTVIWFGNALALVACCSVRAQRRLYVAAAALLGTIIAGIANGDPPIAPVAIVVANGIELFIMLRAVRTINPAIGFGNLRNLMRFIVGCSIIGPAVTLATAATVTLAGGGKLEISALAAWYASDVIGIMLLFPLWLGIKRSLASENLTKVRIAEQCALYMSLCAICYLTFYAARLPLLFCVIPLPIFAAVRLGLVSTVGTLFIVTGLAVHGTMSGLGAVTLINEAFTNERICVLQAFLFITAFLTLLTHVTLDERNRFYEHLQTVAARRRMLADDRIFVGETSRLLQTIFTRAEVLHCAVSRLAARYACRVAAFVEIDGHLHQANAAGSTQPNIPDEHPFPLRRLTRNAFVRSGSNPDEPIIEPGYLLTRLTVERENVGIIALEMATDEPGSQPPTQQMLDEMALVVSSALNTTEYLERDRKMVQILQRELLPPFLPQFPGVAVDALYVPPQGTFAIGGDWYDLLPLDDGRLYFSIGDVSGHGIPAAGMMGKIRAILKALTFAMGEMEPAIRYIDYFLREYEVPMVSVCCGILDTEKQTLQYINAGHPPLLVAGVDEVQVLDGTRTLPLGLIDEQPIPVHTVALEPNAMIVGYTDGIFATDGDLIVGELRLAAAVKRLHSVATSPSPAAALKRAMLDKAAPTDDVAILILQVAPIAANFTLRQRVTPTNARALRRRTRLFAEHWGLSSERVRKLDVSVGEALSNIIEHAYDGRIGEVVYTCENSGDALTIRLADFGRWRPERKDGRGHGLNVMREFCDRVLISHDENGTTIEFRMRLDAVASIAAAESSGIPNKSQDA